MALNAASYYADLTAQYLHYGRDVYGWHYGLWEPDVCTQAAALARSNDYLLRGLKVTPSTRILDVGFGAGGFSVWAASQFGAQLTGITICPAHVEVARDLADRRGVTANCRFLVMNMDELEFERDQFDIVVNQETACYALDKGAYLKQVFRVLKPGGTWRNLDFSIQEGALSTAQSRSYLAVCEGFHIPSLAPLSLLEQLLKGEGFEALECSDLTPEVLRTAAIIRRQCYLPLLAKRLHFDWLVYSRANEVRANRQGHIVAAYEFSRGLEAGVFRYVYSSARKPGLDAPKGEAMPKERWTN